jgi:hypothetical protein
MLSSDTRESHTRRIEFPEGDPETWVRFYRYLEPRSTFSADTLHVNEEDAKALLPWFHLFGMINLLEECDERLSLSSPKFLDDDDDLNDLDHQRSIMTEILVWADTATTYDLSDTLNATMKELNKAVNSFPEMITTEILEKMRPFWSVATGTELWETVKVILPDVVKSSHNGNDAALKANKLLLELVAQSCKVPAQIKTLKSEADFNAIVNLMKKYRSCPRIQQEGCAAFRDTILQNDDSAVEDVIEVIMRAMTAHSNVTEVQEQGCGALANLAWTDDASLSIAANRVSIAAIRGIETIISAMTVHRNVSKVQELGCLALGNLAWRNYANGVSIAAKYGIEAILNAMTAHSNASKVQEQGCIALGIVTFHNNANCISIAAKHGIEAIVSAMTAHIDVPEVQEYGCAALAILAWNDANNILIVVKDGIEAIVSAMTAHSNVLQVQERGCLALGALAGNDANCISIAAKHGIEAILSAMTAYSNVSKVQELGCLALGNLAWNDDANCVLITAKYGIEAIVCAMTAHSNISEVQKYGCSVLSTLTFNEFAAVRIQLEGGLAVLEQNPNNSDAEIALHQIKALINLD